MARKHEEIVEAVQMDWSKENRGRLFKNHNGIAFTKNERPIKFGLGKGTSDLIGFKYDYTRQAPVFCAVEVKTKRSPKLTPEQIDFLNYVASMGGFAYLARENNEGYNLEKYTKREK